jgi:hypothetical protein
MGSLQDRYLSNSNGDPVTVLDQFDANICLTALVDEVRAAAKAARSLSCAAPFAAPC